MKVLHFCFSEQIGGIETFVLNLIRSNTSKIEYGIFASGMKYPFKEELEKYNVNVYVLPSKKNIFSYYKYMKKIMSQYDIIHIHKNSCANVLPNLVAKKVKKKVVVHSHNTKPFNSTIVSLTLHNLFRNYIYNNAAIHLACGVDAGKWLFKDKSFEVINNGVDLEKYAFNEEIRKEIRKELNLPNNAILYGHVGRFNEQKNHKFLINTFKMIYKDDNMAYLLLLGDGKLKEEMMDLAQKNCLSDRIIFAGRKEEIYKYYNAMDCFLFPSIYEGFPIALIEAEANGLPAIISNKITSDSILANNVISMDISNEIDWANFIKNHPLTRVYNLSNDIKKYSLINTVEKVEECYKQLI